MTFIARLVTAYDPRTVMMDSSAFLEDQLSKFRRISDFKSHWISYNDLLAL